jgi:protein transport protein DSL1/ZW10
LSANVSDAIAKIALLQSELAFNDGVAGALESLQMVVGLVDSAGDALSGGEDEGYVDVKGALEKVVQAEKVLGGLAADGELMQTRAVGLVGRRVAAVRERVVEEVKGYWGMFVGVDGEQGRVRVRRETDGMYLREA